MKNLSKITISLMIISGAVFNVSGQTIKERIDSAKVVKVYFENFPIRHNPNTNTTEDKSSIKGFKSGTDCPKFKETTPLPAEYINAEKQIIDLLNKGFNTTAFVEGDIETVPVGYGLTEPPSNYVAITDSYFSMANLSHDWLKLGAPLAFYFYSGGYYNVYNNADSGAEKKLTNSLSVYSSMIAYCIAGGKRKYIAYCAYRNLVNKGSGNLQTQDCNDYAYFLKNFPLSMLAEDFKTSLIDKTNDFIKKEMAKYDKAMKKKK
jgi:hypothetical protein